MTCRQCRRLLLSREGELTDDAMRQLHAHLASCPSCTKEAAEGAAVQHELATVRETRFVVADPEQLLGRILHATEALPLPPRMAKADSTLDRILDLVLTPVSRYAAAVIVLIAVGSALWQTATVVTQVRDLEDRQSRAAVAPSRGTAVAYAVDIREQANTLAPHLALAAGLRCDNGMVFISGKDLSTARELSVAPPGVLMRLNLSGEDIGTLRSWKHLSGIRIRPVLSYGREEGV